MDRAQGDDDAVVQGRGLQFKIELAAETFTQGQPPGAVDTGPVGAVQHQVLVPGLVKEPLEHDVLPGRGRVPGRRGRPPGGRSTGRQRIRPVLTSSTSQRGCGVRSFGQIFIHGAAQARNRVAEFIRPARRLAEPERDIGGLALCVRHPAPCSVRP